MDAGLTWQVVYENVPEADGCFTFIQYDQAVNDYDRAIHRFAVANPEHAKKVSDGIMAQDDLKFRIHASSELQSGLYHHRPIFTRTVENRSEGSPFVEIHTIGHAHWKLLKGQQFKGFRTGGAVENAIREVCQQAGVTVEISATSEALDEFDILYQPGCSYWDFITRYLIPRFGETIFVTTRDCQSLKLEQADKLETLNIDTVTIIVKENSEAPFQQYTLGGGKLSTQWLDPFHNKAVIPLDTGSPLHGSESRSVSMNRFYDRGTVQAVSRGKNKLAARYKLMSLTLRGFIPPTGNLSPSYILKCPMAEIDGILVSVSHVIKGSKYQIRANLWDIQ